MRRQHRAEEVRAVGPDQLGWVVRDDLCHAAVFVGTQSGYRRRRVRLPGRGADIVHLPWDRLEATGRRTEPPSRAGIYGNSHHNSVDYKTAAEVSPNSLKLGEKLNARRCSPKLSASANGKKAVSAQAARSPPQKDTKKHTSSSRQTEP